MDNIAYSILRFIFAPFFRLYYNPAIIGSEKISKTGPLILAGNHKHALDPIIVDLCTHRVVHALAKSELFKGPFGFFFRMIGAVPVDLDARHNTDAMLKAIDYLEKGEIVNVSPEAARNYTADILLPFKKGAVVMSQRTGAKILPYCIVGDYRFRSRNLKIVFGDYVSFDNETVDEANDKLFETIKRLLLENRDEKDTACKA